jgi:hypothetical protein
MTYLQLQQEVARHSRMQLGDAVQEASIQFWVNRSQEDIQSAHSWWFLSHEFEVSLAVSDRDYAFPNTDAAGATADLESIDINSMRTARQSLPFVWPSQLDENDRDWTDSSLAGTGAPQWWTTVREQIILSRYPSSDFYNSNPKLYFRGFIRPADLSAATDVSVIPTQYHNVLLQGALWRAYQFQGLDDWVNAKSLYDVMLANMIARCRPVRGRVRSIGAPRIFSISGRRGANVRN